MANDLSAFDATKFAKSLVTKLNRVNIMLQFADREYEGDLRENSTVKIRTAGNIALADYAGSINYQDLTPSSEDFTVTKKRYFAFKVDDTDARHSDQDINDIYGERAAVAVSDDVENLIMSQYTKAHADNKITGDAGAAIALDKDNAYGYFVEAGLRLNKKNVPGKGRFAVVDPGSAAKLAKAPELLRDTAMGDAVVAGYGQEAVENWVGMIGGFQTFWSNAVPVVASGGSAGKYPIFGQGKPFNYAGQINESELIRLQDAFATACRGLLMHDATVVEENKKRIVTIRLVND